MVSERRKGVCVAAVDKQLQVVADVEPPVMVCSELRISGSVAPCSLTMQVRSSGNAAPRGGLDLKSRNLRSEMSRFFNKKQL